MFIDSTLQPYDTIYALLNGLSWNLAIEAIPMDPEYEYLCDNYFISALVQSNRLIIAPIPQIHITLPKTQLGCIEMIKGISCSNSPSTGLGLLC